MEKGDQPPILPSFAKCAKITIPVALIFSNKLSEVAKVYNNTKLARITNNIT